MLHFAYGSNMHRALMRRHAATATPLGIAELAGHRFIITADGYASIAPMPGESVHGVLWRITPRDRATLDAWESVAAGLYRAATLPVRHAGCARPALAYIARPGRIGAPKSGYMEIVIAAAQKWDLPDAYIASLRQWLPRTRDAVPRKLRDLKSGDLAWT
jgi:cation transport regulator ChaC